MTLAHHVGGTPSVWDSPWPWAAAALLAFAGALGLVAYAMTATGPTLDPYGGPVVPMDGRTVPVGRAAVPTHGTRYPDGDPRARFRRALASPAFQPVHVPEYADAWTGRHHNGWPSHTLLSTGAYPIVDVRADWDRDRQPALTAGAHRA